MIKASEIINETLLKLNQLEKESLYRMDYEFSLGVLASKLLVETTFAKILTMENDKDVSDR